MATQGSPKGGRTEIARRVYVLGSQCSLVGYTNTPNSLGDDSVASDLAQPPLANGYAPISLTPSGWTVVNGVSTWLDASSADPVWTCAADWGVTVNGAAIVFGTTLMHFKDLTSPFVATRGKKLQITLADLFS